MIGRRDIETTDEVDAQPKGFDAYDLRLGDIMRGERATLGKSLLDVQRELKIKATYIAAIENADPAAFETPGFIAGYVRSYARYLGLDAEWAYDTFCKEGNFEVSHGMSPAASGAKKTKKALAAKRDPLGDPDAIFVPRTDAMISRIQPGALGSIAVLAMLVGAIGYGGWSVLQEIQRVEFAPLDQAPGVVAELQDGAVTSTDPLSDTQVAALATAPSSDALDRLYRPQALDVPVLTARDGPIAAIDPSTTGALAGLNSPLQNTDLPMLGGSVAPSDLAPNADVADAPVQVVEADLPEIVLFAVRPSWVRVRAADGTVLFEKTLDANEQYVLPATEGLPTLRAGNAGGIYFSVNGQAYGPVGADGSVVKNVQIGVAEVKSTYEVADLSKDSALADYVRVAQAEGLMIEQAPPASE